MDVGDGDMLYRYRVQIINVNFTDVPIGNLPWAETCMGFTSKFAGDFPPLVKGDTVWVEFEQGDPQMPVVVGSWISNSAGLPDVPADVRVDYARNRQRWRRVDRAGNTVELSELPDEQWVRILSGAAELIMSQIDGSIRGNCPSGPIVFATPRFQVDSTGVIFLHGPTTLLSADAIDGVGNPIGLCQVLSNKDLDIHAQGPAGIGGLVTIGGYVPFFGGAPYPSMIFQTPEVDIVGQTVVIGAPYGTMLRHGVPLLPTLRVDINAQGDANVHATGVGNVNITSDAGNITATAPNITANATTKATVSSPEIELDGPTTVKGDLTIDGQITATGNITSDGDMTAAGAISADGDVTALTAITPVTLSTHLHTGVTTGGGETGTPVLPS